jgi:multidrug resistance efflux pump
MMIVRLALLPILSIAGICLAAYSVHAGNLPIVPAMGIVTPAASPFKTRVSASGIIEAKSRNIALGVGRPGLVTALPHDIGSTAASGDILIQIDDRDTKARLFARRAELLGTQQELARLKSLPRPEEVAPKAAALEVRKAQLADAQNLLELANKVADPRALSREDLTRRQSAVREAEANVSEAQSQLQLIKAGAWQPDLDIASAKIAVAQAAVSSAEAEQEQTQVRAPFSGEVLQVNVRVGEYAAAGQAAQAAIVLGDVTTLHVRADIDEMDTWRFRPEAVARAFLRGNPSISAKITFVAIEPLMVPKRSLTGSSREQVDTRVLQVLYALDPKDLPVKPGQLVDVSIEATAAPEAQSQPIQSQGVPK